MKLSGRHIANILTSLAVALLVVAGGVSGLVPPVFNWYVAGVIVFGLVVILPLLSVMHSEKHDKLYNVLYFVVAHIVSALSIVYVTGANNPFVIPWVVMAIISYTVLGKYAFLLSSITLIGASIMANMINPDIKDDQKVSHIIAGFLLSLLILISAFIIARIINNERKSRIELEATRELEKEQFNKLNTLINSLSDAVLTINSQGEITTENAAALSFFDTNQSLVGKSLESILPLVTVRKEKISIGPLLRSTDNIDRDDLIKITPDGEEIRLSLQLRPVPSKFGDKKNPGYVIILRDITKQKSLEEEKDEFISVASHELRTPVAITEGSLSNLVFLQDKGASPEQLKAAAQEAHKQIVYLSSIINDLSTLSRVERNDEVLPEEIEVKELLAELYAKYSPEAEIHSLEFKLDVAETLPTIVANRLYVEEILQNFITNALKYTKAGSITVKALYENNKVIFSVSDTGIGISKSDQARIFDKFYRSEDFHTRETGGTGLGLYVAQKLASKLGVEITVNSQLGQGSTFSFAISAQSQTT